MEKINYEKLGFRCGLEIHQQLETHKLFCNCPSLVNDPNPVDIKVIRKLRPVAGETGEIDVAAKHEMEKGKFIVYEACSTSSCLVELDEEPPHPINQEALQIALQIAKLLNATIIDEIQVMRKTVVDGSNTSGFQRTALIAINGYVDTSFGKVRIPTICLEEEAAKKIKEESKSITYRLDRLGVPLVEIGTSADIKNPEHAKEVASKLGMILRSTGKVKRGIGTIRQDVNVSISGGARTEIKGFQDLRSIPKVISYEVKRQLDLIKKDENIKEEVRKANSDGTTSFLRPMPGAARMYPETDVETIKPSITKTERVELIHDKAERFEKKYGLGKDLAVTLAKSDMASWFEYFCNKFKKIKPAFIASTLVSTTREIKRKFDINVDNLAEKEFEEVFTYLNDGKISKDMVMDVLIDYAKGCFDIDKYALIEEEELKQEILEIVEDHRDASIGALMGIIMKKYKGKVDGKKVMEILKSLV